MEFLVEYTRCSDPRRAARLLIAHTQGEFGELKRLIERAEEDVGWIRLLREIGGDDEDNDDDDEDLL